MKRAREPEQPTSSPVKRLRKDSLPATPYTPYPQQPSDSPSNPFKRNTRVDSLPPISSFRKHIPLRFQFHRSGVGFRKGGVHRVVQVPLNYTFTHLRALIAWLFDVPPKCSNGKTGEEDYLFEVKTGVTMEATRSKPGIIKYGETSFKLSNSKDPRRSRFAKNAEDQDELEEEQSEGDGDENLDDDSVDWVWADEEDYSLGHVWATGLQADRGIIYHHYPSTQVHITVNTTKLPRRRGKSNVPYVFSARGRVHLSQRPLPRPLFTQSILHIMSSSPAGPSRFAGATRCANKTRSKSPSPNPLDDELSDMDADGDDDPDQKNTTLKPFNKNYLRHNQSPSTSRLKQKTRRNRPIMILVSDSDDESEEDADDDEAYDRLINPFHWNRSHYAFGRYFLSFVDPKGRSYVHLDDEYFEEKTPYDPFENDDDDDDDDEEGAREETYGDEGDGDHDCNATVWTSTPGLTSSSSRSSSSLPPSSPAQEVSLSPALHHPVTDDDDEPSPPSSIDVLSLSPNSSLELHPSIIASHYPNTKYTLTPAPPLARNHRLQLERMERRLERGKKGTYLCEYDEDVDEEVDELFEEDEDEVSDEENGEWIRPVLKEGEVWDPFGDEEEV